MDSIRAVAISGDGALALASGDRGERTRLCVVDLREDRVVVQRRARASSAAAVAGGAWLVGVGYRGLWAFDRISQQARVLRGAKQRLHCVALDAQAERVAGAGGEDEDPHDFDVRVWDLRTGDLLHRLASPGAVVGVGFVDDCRLAAVGDDCVVVVWDLRTGARIGQHRLPGEAPPPGRGTIAPGPRAWVCGGRVLSWLERDQRGVVLWRCDGSRIDAALPILPSQVAVSPSGRRAVLVVEGRAVVVGDLREGALDVVDEVPIASGSAVAFADDGRWFEAWPSGDRVAVRPHDLPPVDSDDEPPARSPATPPAPRGRSARRPDRAGAPSREEALRRLAAEDIDEITALTPFAHAEDAAVIALLLAAGASPDARYPAGSPHSGTPLLAWAVARGAYETVRTLLEAGADPTLARERARIPQAPTNEANIRALLDEAIARWKGPS